MIGTTLAITGELLCEAVDLRPGQRVLDVAAGNGNATLAAARRWADVTSTDYVAALLERGRARAAAERLDVTFQEADAEALPFADRSFDVVRAVFGVMFTPHQEQAAQELLRVCRRGGTIGLANWTPEGFIGQVFRVAQHKLAGLDWRLVRVVARDAAAFNGRLAHTILKAEWLSLVRQRVDVLSPDRYDAGQIAHGVAGARSPKSDRAAGAGSCGTSYCRSR